MKVGKNDRTRRLQIAFFSMRGTNDDMGCLSWYAAKYIHNTVDIDDDSNEGKTLDVSPAYSHCEMRFDDGNACSIVDGNTVHFDKKIFSREGYALISLDIHHKKYEVLYNNAKNFSAREVGFNKAGMLLNFIPILSNYITFNREGRLVFCAELITILLQTIGYLKHLTPHKTSPNLLYKELYKNYNITPIINNSKPIKLNKKK